MRLEIHADCYVAAGSLLVRAGEATGSAATRLTAALAGCRGMAGHAGTAATWAARYDVATASTLAGLATLTAGFAEAASATGRCLAGHRVAEELAALGATAPVPMPARLAPTIATPAAMPSAAGVNGGGPPGWSWFESHLGGRIWPDADTALLRAAATAWRSASADLAEVTAVPREAARELGLLAAPEVAPATDTCLRLAGRADDLARLADGIAARCEAFADAVDSRRHELLDTVAEFLAAVAATEAAGAALGLVTLGVSEVAGQATVASLVGSYAGRLLGLLDALDVEVTAVLPDADVLDADVLAPDEGRITETEADCTSESAAFATAVEASQDAAPLYSPGDLDAWEAAGGHTLARHAGRSDLELRSRLSRSPRLTHASSFASAAHAERAVADAVRSSEPGIRGWLASAEDRLEIDCETPGRVGRVMRRGGSVIDSSRYRVVLVKDAAEPQGYRVLTAFPSHR